MVKECILKNRSYRRFNENKQISKETLVELVDYARCTPSAANKQPLRYYISNDVATNAKIFSCLAWAGYLTDWDGPKEGERPSAYIVMLSKSEGNSAYDEGIAGQSILLMAAEQGLGGCFILNVKKEELKKNLNLPEEYNVKLVLALGEPVEKVVLEEIEEGQDIKYYRDQDAVHHVPKLCLKDVLINM